jgi:hypothetical protein
MLECMKTICGAHEFKLCHDCIFCHFKEEFVEIHEHDDDQTKIEPAVEDTEGKIFKQKIIFKKYQTRISPKNLFQHLYILYIFFKFYKCMNFFK